MVAKRTVWRAAAGVAVAAAFAFVICLQISRDDIYKDLSSSYKTLYVPDEKDFKFNIHCPGGYVQIPC